MRRNKADGVLLIRPRGVKNVDYEKKSNENKIIKLFSEKLRNPLENTDIKINIDIFL